MHMLMVATWGLVALLSVGPTVRTLTPRTTADYGSGATAQTDWYSPGGPGPKVGVFVGHPNSLARGDRALVRFDLAPYLLPPVADAPVRAASLTFRVEAVAGKAAARRIEVSHLRYDASSLGGIDTVNKEANVVGTITVRRDATQPCRLDVTACVKADLWKGNRYSTYRFRDIDAEAAGNPEMQPTGVVIYLNGALPALEVEEGELQVESRKGKVESDR
jgi:hypothetical protein